MSADPVVASSPPMPPTNAIDRDRPQVQLEHPQVPRARHQILEQAALRRPAPRTRPSPTRTAPSSSPTDRGRTRSSNRNRSNTGTSSKRAVEDRPVPHAQKADPPAAAETVPAPAPHHHTPRTPRRNPAPISNRRRPSFISPSARCRPSSARRAATIARVAGAVARPGSHRTVRTLVVYGSSGRRVMTPAAGRLIDLESSP